MRRNFFSRSEPAYEMISRTITAVIIAKTVIRGLKKIPVKRNRNIAAKIIPAVTTKPDTALGVGGSLELAMKNSTTKTIVNSMRQ